MGMYDDIHTSVSETIEIMGIKFYAENITGDEPFNRRERNFTPIAGGTEEVTRGKYIHREYSFTTTVFFPSGRPDAYDDVFQEMMSKPVEVIGREFGNFMAECVVKKIHSSPAFLTLEIQLTEIPGDKSNIPGDEFKAPTDVISTTTIKSKSTSKNSKKTTKKTNKKNNKKKGSKITTTK